MSLQFYVDKAGNRAFVQAKKVFETDALSQSVFLFSGTAYTLTASVGSLTLAAESSTFARTRILTASVGTLSLSAKSATLVRARSMAAAVGTLTLSGQSAILVKALHLTAAKTNLTLTAESATLNKALGLTAAKYESHADSRVGHSDARVCFLGITVHPCPRPRRAHLWWSEFGTTAYSLTSFRWFPCR